MQNTDLPSSDTSSNASEDFIKVLRLMKVGLSKLPCIKYECHIWKIKGLCVIWNAKENKIALGLILQTALYTNVSTNVSHPIE